MYGFQHPLYFSAKATKDASCRTCDCGGTNLRSRAEYLSDLTSTPGLEPSSLPGVLADPRDDGGNATVDQTLVKGPFSKIAQELDFLGFILEFSFPTWPENETESSHG